MAKTFEPLECNAMLDRRLQRRGQLLSSFAPRLMGPPINCSRSSCATDVFLCFNLLFSLFLYLLPLFVVSLEGKEEKRDFAVSEYYYGDRHRRRETNEQYGAQRRQKTIELTAAVSVERATQRCPEPAKGGQLASDEGPKLDLHFGMRG